MRKRPPPVIEARGSSAHLILNPAAGRGTAFLGRLTEAASERGIRVRVLEPGEDARLAALEAAEDGAGTLGVAGGDGSVTAVAGVAVEHELPLVVVPTGTLNHFARDLGLDLVRPLRALRAFAPGRLERRVDVGVINGRHFINNVSLGVYAEMLGDPGYRQDKLRVAQAKLQAAFSDQELRRALRITPPEEAPLESVLAVVVSNNPYEFARWDRLGQRQRLDTGTLQISVLNASTLDELERLLAGTLLGAIEFRPGLRHWMSEHLEMGLPGAAMRAGVDGEPIAFEAPLRISVSPAALRVFVPEGLPASRQVPPLEAGWHAARTLRRWLRPTSAVREVGSDDPQNRMAPDILDPREPGETVQKGGLEQRRSPWTQEAYEEREGRRPMSERPGQVDHTGAEDEHTWTENIEIAGSELVDRTRELIAEGNVRRLIIRNQDDEKLLEVPLTTGVVVGGAFTLLAPILAALGAMAALLVRVKVEIVRAEPKAEGTPDPEER
jgi:diacylglycerol kinase family enzyme